MQRDIRLIADHPAIVAGCDVEDITRAHLDDAPVIHGYHAASGNDHPHMLDLAALGSNLRSDVHRPLPTRIITSAAESHSPQPYHIKSAFLEGDGLIGFFESLQDYVKHKNSPARARRKATGNFVGAAGLDTIGRCWAAIRCKMRSRHGSTGVQTSLPVATASSICPR